MSKIIEFFIKGDGNFPNNASLPVLLYPEVFNLERKNTAEIIQETFMKHSWYRPWINGIYDFHHYHSNNHEVLGIAKGTCLVLLGGEKGISLEIKNGDVLILPAGISHKRITCSPDFTCVGAYAIDLDYNMKYGKKSEKQSSIKEIKTLPLPKQDPVFGKKGPLFNHWK